ncbi:MAG: carbohydrate ABC transporter permease [Anaerolineae bacterium]|nr:carbohydrate ABC transporter permease [Anaerolineae bacterium]
MRLAGVHPRKRQRSVVRTVAGVLPHVLLIACACSAIVPFLWMVTASLKSFKELVTSRSFFPQVWTLKNYQELIFRVNFPSAFKNSIIAGLSVTVVMVLTSSALGFVFAKYRFWGKEHLFTLLLSTMMVPFAVVLVPLYLTVGRLGLINQLGGIIVTGFWSTFGVFMMRQFMETIPSEIIDAARIDGAGEPRIFFTIIIPMAAAPMAALAIFGFMDNWDSFLWPLVVLNSPNKQTLPLVIAGLRSLYWTRYEMWATGSMLSVVPVMAVYALASKYFIRGIAMSGLKA